MGAHIAVVVVVLVLLFFTVCERVRERFYESEESEMKRGRGLRWSVVKGIVFREPHMSVCVMLFYFIQVCLCLVLTFKNCTVQLTCSIFVF